MKFFTALPIIAGVALRAHAAPVSSAASTSTSARTTTIPSHTSTSTTATHAPSQSSTFHGQHIAGPGVAPPPRPNTNTTVATDSCGIVSIVYPSADTTWISSTRHNVTWNTEHLSDTARTELTAYKDAKLYLGRDNKPIESYLVGGQDHPLAEGFALTDQQVEVSAPEAMDGDGWQILIYADRTDPRCGASISSEFKIHDVVLNDVIMSG